MKFLFFFLILTFIFPFIIVGSIPYEFQTVKEAEVSETYLLLHSYVLLNDEAYFDWEDIRDFFLSALATPGIEKNMVLNSIEMTMPQGTVKFFFHDNIVLWNNLQIRINNPLLLREGRLFIHSNVLEEIARKSGIFSMRRLDKIPDALEVSAVEEEKAPAMDFIVLPLPPEPEQIRIGFLLKFSPEIPGQISAAIEENLKTALNDFFSTAGELHYFTVEDPLTLAEKVNRKDLHCFLHLHFPATHQPIDKTARIFFITSEVHPLEIDRRRLSAGYEYRTTFKQYETHNKSLANQLEESMKNLTEIRIIGSGQGMIRILQYLSLPSIIIEFYNLDLDDDQNFFFNKEHVNSLARALKAGVEKFID